jgi:GntR family transcriptional regulator
MLLNLSDQSSETLQNQLEQQVRALILAGDLSEGSELPSIRSLAKEQRVSVITVQRAYETLEHTGLIRARRGKGFFVAPLNANQRHELALERLETRLEPVLEQALAEGLSEADIAELVQDLLKGAWKGVPT